MVESINAMTLKQMGKQALPEVESAVEALMRNRPVSMR